MASITHNSLALVIAARPPYMSLVGRSVRVKGCSATGNWLIDSPACRRLLVAAGLSVALAALSVPEGWLMRLDGHVCDEDDLDVYWPL